MLLKEAGVGSESGTTIENKVGVDAQVGSDPACTIETGIDAQVPTGHSDVKIGTDSQPVVNRGTDDVRRVVTRAVPEDDPVEGEIEGGGSGQKRRLVSSP